MSDKSEALQVTDNSYDDRRDTQRVTLELAIEVTGRAEGQRFCQRTVTIDVNLGGCKFVSIRRLRPGELISIRRVWHDVPTTDAIEFEVVWVEAGERGWVVGASKRGTENIWPMFFPKKASADIL